MLECLSDCQCKRGSREIELTREQPNVEEVFHARVERSELHHRFELFGDDCLAWVHAQVWGREVEECWVVSFLGARADDIAEADVDLYRDTRTFKKGEESESDALVVGILFDSAANERRRIEAQTVVDHGKIADL